MDITLMFLSAIIMTIIGFVTTALFGFNVKKLISDFSMILFFVPVAIFLITTPPGEVEAATSFLTDFLNNFANMLPGMIIGEFVGSFANKVVGAFRDTRR